ncbi:MAG: PaaI family thioesterase, partial [Candidatus Marinimicrobia bacterium]|nr:PaaI family thioesterase [Candidatus Neomarinimicrobiota bacterium]
FTAGLGFIPQSADPGHAKGQLEIQPQHLNRSGTLHGGLAMTMLDSLMGQAVRTWTGENGQEYVTSSMTTHLLETVSEGQVTGSSRVIAQGGTYLLTEAELRDAGRRLIATAEAVYTRLRAGAQVGDR